MSAAAPVVAAPVDDDAAPVTADADEVSVETPDVEAPAAGAPDVTAADDQGATPEAETAGDDGFDPVPSQEITAQIPAIRDDEPQDDDATVTSS